MWAVLNSNVSQFCFALGIDIIQDEIFVESSIINLKHFPKNSSLVFLEFCFKRLLKKIEMINWFSMINVSYLIRPMYQFVYFSSDISISAFQFLISRFLSDILIFFIFFTDIPMFFIFFTNIPVIYIFFAIHPYPGNLVGFHHAIRMELVCHLKKDW